MPLPYPGINQFSDYFDVDPEKDLLGEGAFGRVYTAVCKRSRATRAVKVISKSKLYTVRQQQFIQREIAILQDLNHPNTVPVYEVMQTRTELFIVMDRVGTCDLVDYLHCHKKVPWMISCGWCVLGVVRGTGGLCGMYGWGGDVQSPIYLILTHPQYANYWAPLTRKRHTMPHSAQPQHTNYWAPRTRKRHQQEHRPQRPTERSDPTQHAKGRTGDRSGPRKGATTRRNVTQGDVQSPIYLLYTPCTPHAGWRAAEGAGDSTASQSEGWVGCAWPEVTDAGTDLPGTRATSGTISNLKPCEAPPQLMHSHHPFPGTPIYPQHVLHAERRKEERQNRSQKGKVRNEARGQNERQGRIQREGQVHERARNSGSSVTS